MSQFNLRYVPTLSCSQFILNGQQFNTQAANLIDGNGNITATPALTTQVIINDATKNQALFAEIFGNIHGNTFPQLQAEIVALQGNVLILQGEMNAVEGNVAILQGNVITINNQIANISSNVSGLTANTQYLHAPYTGLAGNTSYFTNGLQVWNGGSETGNGIFSYVDGGAPANQIRLSVQNAKGIFLDGGSTTIAPTSGGNVNITGSGGTAPFNFNVKNPGLLNANIRMVGDIELTGNGNSSISIFTQPASLIPPSPATDYVNIRGGNQAQILGPAINVAADSSLNLQAGTGGTVSLGTPSTGSTNSTINIGTNQGSTNTGYQVITIGSGGILQARNSSTFLEGDNYLPYVAATNTGLWDGIAYVGLPTTYSGPLHGPLKTTYTPYVKSISCFFAGVTLNSFVSSGGSFTVGVGIGSINLTCGAGGFLCSTGAGLLALTTGVGVIALTTAGGAITATTGGGALQFSLGAGSFTSTTGVGIQRLETGSADIQIAAGYAAGGSSGDVVITAKGNIAIEPDIGLYLEKVSHAAFVNNGTTPPGLPNYSLYTVNGNLFFNGTDISSSSGVSQVIAGNGITVSPVGGTGVVTVSAIGSVIPPGGYLPVIGGNMVGDIFMKNTASSAASHIYQGDGAGQVKLFRPMSSYQAPFPSIGPPTYTGELLCFYNGDNNSPTQSNFTGWFPQSLVSAEPDFMTQLIAGAPTTVYSLANTSTPSAYDNTSCTSFPTFTNGVHITGGTVYISQIETTKPLTLTFGYPDGTPFYTKTFAAGSFPSSGLFTFTVDYTHTLSTGQYTAYWDNSNQNFSLMVANPVIKTNWCGTLTAGTASYYLMVFNSGLTSQIFKWFPGQNTTEKVFVLDGSVYGIQEQLIGSSVLYFYGLFDNITVPGPVSARVNNIFTYNVNTGIVQTLRADTALQQNPPIGTNGAVYGVEVDSFNDRTWFWGNFTYVGTDYLGNPTPPRNDIALICGCDFTTTADWQLPVMFEGINGYSQCRGGKLLNYSGAGYSLMVWATEISNGGNPPTFSAFNAVGMNYYQTGTFVWTVAAANCMSGGSISQPVANIQRISNAGSGSNTRLFFTGNFNNGVAYPTSATCLSIMYSVGGSSVDNTNGQYTSELYEAYQSSNNGFWVDNGVQISVSNVRKMTNDVFVMNTNGYGLTNGGGVLALQSVDQTGALPTKYNITGMPRYSTKFIGGNDATKILLTCSLNENNFFYSQTFDSTPSPTPIEPTVIAINGAKFLVDNTDMDKIVFAGSNQDYSSVSFIAGKVEDNDYNWYWQSQVGALDYYSGATFYPNVTSSPASLPGPTTSTWGNVLVNGNIASKSIDMNNFNINNLNTITPIAGNDLNVVVSGSGSLHITQSSVGGASQPMLELENTNGGTIAAHMDFYKNSASPALDDIIGAISMHANNASSTKVEYARISATQRQTTAGSENGSVSVFCCANSPTATEMIRFNGDGDSGVGTIDLYKPINTRGNSIKNTLAGQTLTITQTVAQSILINNTGGGGISNTCPSNQYSVTCNQFFLTASSSGTLTSTSGNLIFATGTTGIVIVNQTAATAPKLRTDIANVNYYPEFIVDNANSNAIVIPPAQVFGEKLILVNKGVSPLVNWLTYGTSQGSVGINAMISCSNGEVYVARADSDIINIWDSGLNSILGSFTVGGGGNQRVYCFYEESGYMFVGGSFTSVNSNAIPQINLTRIIISTRVEDTLEGSGYNGFGGYGVGRVNTLCSFNGELIVGGDFTQIYGNTSPSIPCNYIGKVNNQTFSSGLQSFSELANGVNNIVYALNNTNALLFVGGSFTYVNSNTYNYEYLATWDSSNWNYVVSPTAFNASVTTIMNTAFYPYLFIGGSFTAPHQYACYVDWSNPSTTSATDSGRAWSYPFVNNRQQFYNGNSYILIIDDVTQNTAYQTWVSLGTPPTGYTPSYIGNFNGELKVAYENNGGFVYSKTVASQTCAFTLSSGNFKYNGTLYTTYTLGLIDVAMEFLGDTTSSPAYWRPIGYAFAGGSFS